MGLHTFTVTVHSAEGLEKVITLGTQDPFVSLKAEEQQFKTRTHTDGGSKGVFNETFTFNRLSEKVFL